MDNCKKYKDLILTNYIDGEMDTEMKQQVDSHLLVCPNCRRFAEEVNHFLVASFKNAVRKNVPEHLWLLVKENIEKENRLNEKAGNFIHRLMESLSFPALAPVLGSFVLLILVGSLIFYNQQMKQGKEKEQVEYLVYLLGATEVSPETENNVPETPIEKYFL